jgi:hypothetical protein
MNPDRERKGNKAAARVGGFDRGESHDTMEICCSQSETDRMTVSNQIDGIDTYYYDLLWGLKQIKGSTRMCRTAASRTSIYALSRRERMYTMTTCASAILEHVFCESAYTGYRSNRRA